MMCRYLLLVLILVVGAYFAGTMNLLPSIPFLASSILSVPSSTAPSPSSSSLQPQSFAAPPMSSPESSSSINPRVVQAQQQQQLSDPIQGNKIGDTDKASSSSAEISLP
ncbi:MAG: hypothetical protein WBX81_14275, partial [Nitrososphaeraceae archaeon]